MSRAEVVAVIMDIVRVHLREQEGVDQDRDKNHADEDEVSRLGCRHKCIIPEAAVYFDLPFV
jgi:hypothetical protein